MDAIDREILAALLEDGRATMTNVADRVGLSLSACHRRFKDLQTDGVITGFRAELDAARLGMPFEALVIVTLGTVEHTGVVAFEEAVAQVENVVAAHRLFGEPDYQLRVVARSLQDYQELYDARLTQLPSVSRLTSTLVMKTVVERHVPV